MPERRLIEEFTRWQTERRGLTAGYAYQSRQKLVSLADWLGPASWAQLDEPLVERWAWRTRRSGQPGAASTIEKDLVVARSFYQWLARRGHVEHDPTAEVTHPKIRNKNPNPISDACWLEWYRRTTYVEDDCILFMGLGYLCGLRLAEILRLRDDHFLPSGQIVGLERKGGGDDVLDVTSLVAVIAQQLPMLLPDGGDRFLSLLWERVHGGGMIFDWRASARAQRIHALGEQENDPQWIYKRIKKWQRWANPRPTELWRPHRLRHAFVTNLLRAGVPLHLVSVLSNHSNPSITMRYAKLGGQDLREFLRAQDGGAGAPLNRFAKPRP